MKERIVKTLAKVGIDCKDLSRLPFHTAEGELSWFVMDHSERLYIATLAESTNVLTITGLRFAERPIVVDK
jgi:hypothetical protein